MPIRRNFSIAGSSVDAHVADGTIHFTQGDISIPSSQLTDKGTSGGVCPLGSDGRVPSEYMNIEALHYKGQWDASTNTPTLSSGVGDTGDFYIVSVAGTVDFGGGHIETFSVRDWAIYYDDLWWQAPNVQNTDELPEGSTNLYFTEQRVQDVQLKVKQVTPAVSADAYTLDGTECDKFIHLDNAADMDLNIILQTSDEPFGTGGWHCIVRQVGLGKITVVPAVGVTVHSEEGLETLSQNACFGLLHISKDIWYAYGINTMSAVTDHMNDATIHFIEGDIDHDNILSVGTYDHSDIDNHIDDLTVHFQINDASTSGADVAWSADKIYTELNTKADESSLSGHTSDGSIHFEIDDTSVSGTGVAWSADKIYTELNTKADESSLSGHTSDGTIHYIVSDINHQAVSGAGTYTHENIDNHIDDLTVHFQINDASTSGADVAWSANKIHTEFSYKTDKYKGANAISPTAHTLELNDADKWLYCDNANNVEIEIPEDLVVDFNIGTETGFWQKNAGKIIFTWSNPVTAHSLNGYTRTEGQYAVASIRKISANEWFIYGELEENA